MSDQTNRKQLVEILYDLCQQCIPTESDRDPIFQNLRRQILKKDSNGYSKYLSEWAIHQLLEQTKKKNNYLEKRYDRNPEELYSGPEENLKHFTDFFSRLSPEEQIYLLLKFKYEFTPRSLETIFRRNSESLKLYQDQTLKQLASWIWSNESPNENFDNKIPLLSNAIQSLITFQAQDRRASARKNPKAWGKKPWYFRYGFEALGAIGVAAALMVLVPWAQFAIEKFQNQSIKSIAYEAKDTFQNYFDEKNASFVS